MGNLQFTGQSENGNIADAINDAVKTAQKELLSDFVEWRLAFFTGEYGGFTDQKHLKATIDIISTGPKDKKKEISDLYTLNTVGGQLLLDKKSKGYQSVKTQREERLGSQEPLENPEDKCRKILGELFGAGSSLPQTKNIELYYIRCLGYTEINGKLKEWVVFNPEFLYVIDLGYPLLAGISTVAEHLGLGFPQLPNFDEVEFRSVKSTSIHDLMYPLVAGDLMIGTRETIEAGELEKKLSPYAKNVEGMGDFFSAKCRPFDELNICKEIEQNVPDVRYAAPNPIVRIIDSIPGWRVDRVL